MTILFKLLKFYKIFLQTTLKITTNAVLPCTVFKSNFNSYSLFSHVKLY